MDETTTTESPVIEVRNWSGFTHKWAEIAKRAERTGVQIGYEIVEDRIDQERICGDICCDGPNPLHGTRPVRVRVIQVWGDRPKFAGYELVAVIDDLNEAMRQVRGVPGHEADLPDTLWTTDSHCDHCGHNRQRNTVMILAKDGELVQVGSTCIKDFLGGHSPAEVAWMSTWLPELAAANDNDYEGSGGSWEHTYDPKLFLATVVALIDMEGWVSRGQAKAAAEAMYG